MIPKRHVIPVFVPHVGCPNDCVFCNQRRISGQLDPATPETVRRAVDGADFLRDDGTIKQLAFYGGSFTAIPEAEQTALLDAAKPFLEKYRNASIRISTRPDRIDTAALERLKAHGVATIELGAQSMDDAVLRASGRGHTAQNTIEAAGLIKEYGFELILQMMTGLPGDTPQKSMETAKRLIALRPAGVRLYPTVIIRDTKLHEMWLKGGYKEHTVEDAVTLCAELYDMFEKAHIPIIRLGLNPSEELSAVAGAYHPALGELVLSRVYLSRARALLEPERMRMARQPFKSVTLGVSPGRVSVMTGQKRHNIEALQRAFHIDRIRVTAADVNPGEIVILSIDNDV